MLAKKSIPWIVFSRMLGLLTFLFFLYMANLFSPTIAEPVFHQVLGVLNDNLILLVLMSLVFLIAELFFALPFPLSLAAPPINAAGVMLLLTFLFDLIGFIDVLTGEKISDAFKIVSLLLYPLVFLAVLLAGYVNIFRDLVPASVKDASKSARDWKRVGEEFRQAFSDLFTLLGREMGGR